MQLGLSRPPQILLQLCLLISTFPGIQAKGLGGLKPRPGMMMDPFKSQLADGYADPGRRFPVFANLFWGGVSFWH